MRDVTIELNSVRTHVLELESSNTDLKRKVAIMESLIKTYEERLTAQAYHELCGAGDSAPRIPQPAQPCQSVSCMQCSPCSPPTGLPNCRHAASRSQQHASPSHHCLNNSSHCCHPPHSAPSCPNTHVPAAPSHLKLKL